MLAVGIICFIVGAMVGAMFGIFLLALLQAGHIDEDDVNEQIHGRDKERTVQDNDSEHGRL